MKTRVSNHANVPRLGQLLIICLFVIISTAGCSSQASTPTSSASPATSASSATANPSTTAAQTSSGTRTVTDTAGRQVSLPAQINRVVTVGSVPVLNSFLFAVGEGDKLVNGLPQFAQNPMYKFETVFAPNIANAPVVQGPAGNSGPNMEDLLKVQPDLVVTSLPDSADEVTKAGIATIVLQTNTPDNIKNGVLLMGDIFNQQQRATDYVNYFNETDQRVKAIAATIPEADRPSVLYLNMQPLRRPNLIMEWMLAEAGGNSVTRDVTISQCPFSVEQLLQWNPDVLIGMYPDDYTQLTTDPRFQELKAVKDHRIYVVPTGAHIWGNNTTEQPIALLWIAKQLFPDQFKDIDIAKETKAFYERFYNTTLTDEQIQELLTGKR